MSLYAYLTVTAQRQGLIRGSVTQRGREDKILVLSSSHAIVCPRDPASGRPTGKRMHKPFNLTKEVDRASPLLYQALVNNERLTDWQLQFWRSGKDGLEKQHYTVQLTNATLCGITLKMPNNKHTRLMRFSEYEELSFTYQKIAWTWTEGGVSAADDWEAPRY